MAVSFASSGYYTIGTGLSGPTTFSGSAWFYITGTGFRVILGCYNGGSPFNGWGWGLHSNGRLAIWDSTSWRQATTVLATSTWLHVGFTVSGSTISFYVDGSSDGTGTWSPTDTTYTAASHRIGQTPTAASLFGGNAQELAVWNGAALSAAEMSSLAAGVSPTLIRPQHLTRYWPLIGITARELMAGQAIVGGSLSAVAHRPMAYSAPLQIVVPAAAAGGAHPVNPLGHPLRGPFGGPI